MLVSQGTYGPNSTQSNSFVANALKYPEISSVVVDLFPQYSMSYFVEGTGRYSTTAEVGDRIVKWPVQGRLQRASVIDSTYGAVTVGAANAAFVIPFDPNELYLNPNDVVRLPSGQNALVLDITGANVTLKLMNSTGASVTTTNFAGSTVGRVDSAFEEGSIRGYSNQSFPDWHQNALGISRAGLDITGSALTDILWIEYNGQKLWFFEAERKFYEDIEYIKEVARWTGQGTVNALGNSTMTNLQGQFIYKGDGLLEQVSTNNIDTYGGTLTEQQITNFIAMLQLTSGMKGAEYMVWTGTAGLLAFDRAMKDYFVQQGALVFSATAGSDITLGGKFSTYHALGSKIVLAYNPIFDDPIIFGNDIINTANGAFPRQSFEMFFCNISMMGKESNLSLAVKSAGGINRSRIIKYIPGMVDPHNPSSMYAASGDDKFRVEYLSEDSIILNNPYAAGRLVYA